MPTHIVWIAYSVSNLVALLILWACWKRPVLARVLFVLLFGWAAWFNSSTALHQPDVYQGYARFALSYMYETFIRGYFARHTTPVVLTIAVGQALITLGMLAKGRLFRAGAVGGIVFLLAIAPLGVGSAFPATLLLAGGMALLYRLGSTQWLWQALFSRETSPRSFD